MTDYLDIAAAEARRKDILRQAEVARQIERAVPSPDYAEMLLKEAGATFGHAVRFLKVLVSAARALLMSQHGVIERR